MKNLYLLLAGLIVGSLLGFFLKPNPTSETKEKIVYQDRIVRKIVRTTAPDGSSREVIDEIENRDGTVDRVVKKTKDRRFFVGAAGSVIGPSAYQIDAGYKLFTNLSIKASLIKIDGEVVSTVGVQVEF